NAMASDKAMYLVAAVVMATGITTSYLERHPGGIDVLELRSSVAAEQLASRAEAYVSIADSYLSRGDAAVSRSQDAVSRIESRMSLVEETMVRGQCEISRRQAECMRSMMVRVPAKKFVCSEIPEEVTVDVSDDNSNDEMQ